MKHTAQAEPSAWSLAEEAPDGIHLGSLRARRQRRLHPVSRTPAETAGGPGWYSHSQGPLTHSSSRGFHPPPLFYMSGYIVDLVCNLFTWSVIFTAFTLHFLYLKTKILDLVYSLCLILSSSLCKVNLELRSPLLWGGACLTAGRGRDLAACLSPRLSTTSGGAALQAPSSLVGTDDEGTLSRACFTSPCDLGWNQCLSY